MLYKLPCCSQGMESFFYMTRPNTPSKAFIMNTQRQAHTHVESSAT